jgi:hypothetical protein
MFILGTSSVLAIVPQDQIDLVSPIPQTLTMGFAGLGFVRFIVPILILLLLSRQIGNVALIFAGKRGCRWSPDGTACSRPFFAAASDAAHTAQLDLCSSARLPW